MDYPSPFSNRDLDAILDDVRYDVPEEAGTVYVAQYVINRIREGMAAKQTVFYQP